ncbi:MAG: hypothetical protein KDA84_23335 [Planctomycetaceae bacterium]|nr:hypothetical protein [Planctomycetaceae bacterium]
MARWILSLSVVLLLEPGFALAQGDPIPLPNASLLDVQPGERGVPEMLKLAVYKPKHLPSDSAGELLRELMGKSVTVVVEPVSNSVLIRGSESQIREAKAILEVLDQRPKTIAIEVLFADLPVPAEETSPQKPAQTSDEFWLKRLKEQKGKSKGNIKTIRLTATENQKAMVQFGEQTSVVSGVQRGFGGRGAAPTRTPVLRQEQTGTLVQCTASVTQENTIIAQFEIERSGFAPPEKATVVDESDDEGTLKTPGLMTTTCKTTLTLQPGKARVLSGQILAGAAGNTQSVIVITAELIDSNE